MKHLPLLVLFLSVTAAGSAQQPASPRKHNSEMMSMPLVAPLFIEDGDYSSELVIVNASTEKTYADVELLDVRGHKVAQRRVQLAPASQSKVKLVEMLRDARSSTSIGSVLVVPSHELMGMSVAAQLMITAHLGPIIGNGTAYHGCFIGNEVKATIIPSTYTGTVILHRWIQVDKFYKDQVLIPTD